MAAYIKVEIGRVCALDKEGHILLTFDKNKNITLENVEDDSLLKESREEVIAGCRYMEI